MTVRYFQRRSTPARIVDVLETTGEAFTFESLHAELVWRFGPVVEKVARRACQRVQEKGIITVGDDGLWRRR